MTKIYTLKDILPVINVAEIIQTVEEGFLLYKNNQVVVAPLSSLEIEKKGIAKIKYGYVKGQDMYLMKVGSFFPENKKSNLPTINASMQLYSQHTGVLEALLLDQAYLTNARTAAASAIVAKYCAPFQSTKIGIIGTGVQARFQLEYLRHVFPCKEIIVFGRDRKATEQYRCDMEQSECTIEIAENITDMAKQCNIIVIATSAKEPVIYADQVQPGTLIISVGADAANKQEVDPTIFKKAGLVIADSKSQCCQLGNIFYALQENALTDSDIVELGDIIEQNNKSKHEYEIIVANLTGVIVQDIQIANLVYQALLSKESNHDAIS